MEPLEMKDYHSRKGLMKFGLGNLNLSRMTFSKDRNVPAYAVTLVSDETSKDMGGLLQEGGRDFLFYLAGAKDAKALGNNKKLAKAVSIIRKVHGPGLHYTSRAWYICCGDYEVSDSWSLDSDRAYFKLLRLPGQPLIALQELFYKDEDSVQARGFRTTYKIYKGAFGLDCSRPCERIPAQDVSQVAMSQESGWTCDIDICEVCGINGDQIDMVICECCNERGLEVSACYTCLHYQHLEWLLEDPDSIHHWRCSSCRTANRRPKEGIVFEDVSLLSQVPAQTTAAGLTNPATESVPAAPTAPCVPKLDPDHTTEATHPNSVPLSPLIVAPPTRRGDQTAERAESDSATDISPWRSGRANACLPGQKLGALSGRKRAHGNIAGPLPEASDRGDDKVTEQAYSRAVGGQLHDSSTIDGLPPCHSHGQSVRLPSHPPANQAQSNAGLAAPPRAAAAGTHRAAAVKGMGSSTLPLNTHRKAAIPKLKPPIPSAHQRQAQPSHTHPFAAPPQQQPHAHAPGLARNAPAALVAAERLQTGVAAVERSVPTSTSLSAVRTGLGDAATVAHLPAPHLPTLAQAPVQPQLPGLAQCPAAAAPQQAQQAAPETDPADAMMPPALSRSPIMSVPAQPEHQVQAPVENLLPNTAPLTATHAGMGSQSAQTAGNQPPSSILELADMINGTLPQRYQLDASQVERMESAFGDVELLQDLWQMRGDALNGQLRTAGNLNALQICAVRQLLSQVQQQCNE